MAVRFYSDFRNDRGRYFRVRLHDSDFSGSATEVTSSAEGFELSYDGGNQDVFAPIMSSRLRFQWFNTGGALDTFLNDVLPTRSEGKILVDVYTSTSEINAGNAGAAYWRGVMLAEQVVQADEPTPSVVEFTATDDLKQLKEHTNVPGTATASPSDTTLRGYVVNCLSFTRSYSLWDTNSVYLYYFNDFEPDGYTGSDAFVSLFINHLWRNGSTPTDSDYYYDAYTILEDLAQSFNARVFQAGGAWYFMPLNILQRRADDEDFSAAFKACKKDTTPVTIITATYNAWRNNQLVTTSEATKLAGGSREYSLGVKSVKRSRTTGTNDFLLRGTAFQFPQLDESANDIAVSDGDFTYYSGQTFVLVYGYNISIPSVDSPNNSANFITLQLNVFIQFGSRWFTESGWVSTPTPYRLVIGEYYRSFGFNEGGEIPIQIEPLPSAQTGADLTANLKALGIGGGEVTDDLPASHYANQSVTLYYGEDGTGQGDAIVFESETSEDNQERVDQGEVVIGTTQLTNGVVAGSNVQSNNPNGAIELTAGPVLDFTSSQTSTAYSLHRLGVREAVEALQLPHEIRNGTLYVEDANTLVWPYSLFSADGEYWGVHEFSYRANASEVSVKRWQLKRDTSNIVFLDDVTTGVNDSGQAPTQGNTAARTAAQAFARVQTGELAEFVNVIEIEHSVGDSYTIDADDNNGHVYFNRWIDSATGFSSIVLPKVADNEGRVIRLKTDASVAANKYIKLGPTAEDYTNGTRIDGADSFALDRDYDGISVLCFESQWYVIQRKGKGGGGGVSALDDLDDVDVGSASDGQVLKYNATDSEWQAAADDDTDAFADLTDVNPLLAPAPGDLLTWTNVNGGQWNSTTAALAVGGQIDVGDLANVSDSTGTAGNILVDYNLSGPYWVSVPASTWAGTYLALQHLANVSGTPSSGDLLQYNGTQWVPYTPPAAVSYFTIQSSFYTGDGNGDYIPIGGTLSETTSSQYYNRWTAPMSGEVVSARVFTTSSTAGSSTIAISKYPVPSTIDSDTQTISTANNDVEFTFDTATFVAGDQLRFWFDPTGSPAGVSITILIKLEHP